MPALRLPLETRRLLLREFEPADLAAVRAYALDPRVAETVLHDLKTERDLTRHFATVLNARALRPRRSYELAIAVRRTGALIGTCELSLQTGASVELGYMLARRHWGFGYATEVAIALRDTAFDLLKAARVRALVAVDNEASRRVLVKAGLQWAALRRRHTQAKGRWWDCEEYELLRSDWQALPRTAPGRGAARGA